MDGIGRTAIGLVCYVIGLAVFHVYMTTPVPIALTRRPATAFEILSARKHLSRVALGLGIAMVGVILTTPFRLWTVTLLVLLAVAMFLSSFATSGVIRRMAIVKGLGALWVTLQSGPIPESNPMRSMRVLERWLSSELLFKNRWTEPQRRAAALFGSAFDPPAQVEWLMFLEWIVCHRRFRDLPSNELLGCARGAFVDAISCTTRPNAELFEIAKAMALFPPPDGVERRCSGGQSKL